MRWSRGAALALAGIAAAGPVHAQPAGSTPTDIEVPAVVVEQGDTQGPGADEALDLANIVQSAAKGVTTVQEAPAIVTVITADEIRDRQFQDLQQLIETVPGWQRASTFHSTFPASLVRGQVQAVQFLHDGVSLFDPFINVPSVSRVQPMELVKRVEMITGPGGVLWGSNSLLGILNIITKDAEDVDGVEVGAQIGDGGGDRLMARAYAMAGATNLAGGKAKVFAHASVQTWQGPGFDMPLLLFHNALPQPNSPNQYGPLTGTDQARSMIVTLDGKLTYDKLQLRVFAPFGHLYNPMGLSGQPVRDTLPEDPQCPVGSTDGGCTDPARTSRKNREDIYDRYAVVEYRTRFARDKAGIAVRGYLQQFVRGFEPLQVLAASTLIHGGLSFKADLTSYRTGGALDGDVELTPQVRMLYGAEAFREWKPDMTSASLQGSGTPFELSSPSPTLVPLPCPRDAMGQPVAGCPLTFAFPADRTVFGAYVDPQYRPSKSLIFDLGGRVQVAPAAFGSLHYDPNFTVAATVVWNFIPNWHLKVNYAQGFRPPVFNNTAANGEAVQIGGNPNLSVETSDATQAEVNARIFKGDRRIRELSFRIDGSYTRINNLIQVSSGNYSNSGDRAMTSLEFLGKLYLQGGHRLELGYTYLRGDTSDKGRLRSLPENWFSLAGVWSLIGSQLTATTTLKITGAAEDPNRLVEYRGSTYTTMCATGDPACKLGAVNDPIGVLATDLVLDRLPPMADLSLGVQYAPTPKLTIRASAYNALFSHAYQPDVFFDYEPHLEYLPNPYEGFRAYLTMTYQY